MAHQITILPTGDPTLAGRYLADQLPEAERTAFELRMIEDPAVLREVEATARFKAGLQHAQAAGQLEQLLAPRPSPAPYLAFAAMLALVAVGIGLWRTQDASTLPWVGASLPQLAQALDADLPAGRTYTVLRLRSEGGVDLVADLPAGRSAILLRILPDSSEPGSRHLVTLLPVRSELTEAPSPRAVELVADERGYLSLFVDSASLQPDLYQLQIAPAADTGEDAEGYLIRFQPQGRQP